MIAAIVGVLVIVSAALLLMRFRGKNRFPWYEFFSKGRREGFSLKEISFLKNIAIQNKVEQPQSIFWSTKQLDRCLKPAIQKIYAEETMSPEHKLEMVGKLLDLRTKAEFNLPRYRKKIRDTFSLLPRQKLVIKDRDFGLFVSWVVEISRKNLVVTQPAGQKASGNLNWTGRKVLVSFWRADDAGYEFATKVLEQIRHEEFPLLYLSHSNSLERNQLRKGVRVGMNIRAQFYPIEVVKAQGVNKPVVSKRGFMGKIIDLSEGGCCMLAGRLLKKNSRLKLEFDLTPQKRVVAIGVAIGVSKTGDERVQKIHIMFVRMGAQSRHNVLLYVYNIFGEREEERSDRRAARSSRPASSTVSSTAFADSNSRPTAGVRGASVPHEDEPSPDE